MLGTLLPPDDSRMLLDGPARKGGRMSEPMQKPGRSKQDYGTPWEFIRAVEGRWGVFSIDLAAWGPANAKAPAFLTPLENSLECDWNKYAAVNAWLNPPFGNIGDWAAKCARHLLAFTREGGRIILLTPASIGSEWFEAHHRDWTAPAPHVRGDKRPLSEGFNAVGFR